jgi:hypothetical protein
MIFQTADTAIFQFLCEILISGTKTHLFDYVKSAFMLLL